MPSVANNQYKMLTIVNWLLVLSTLATFTTAFAAPMPSVTIDVQKADETIEPVPMMEHFSCEAKDRADYGADYGVRPHSSHKDQCRILE